MCVLRISLLLFLFFQGTAEAKVWNFDSGAAFGLGFRGVAAKAPSTDVIDNASALQSFSKGFSFEPFFDFGNFVVRLVGQGYFPPNYSNAGVVSSYSDTADFYLTQYGLHIQLCPFVSNDNRRRLFLKAGYSFASLKGENVRTYTDGRSFQEKYTGSGTEILAATGFEFFLAQNYTLSWEVGYTMSEVKELSYQEGTNLTGVEQRKGAPLLTTGGANRKVNLGGPYLGLGLNLNF